MNKEGIADTPAVSRRRSSFLDVSQLFIYLTLSTFAMFGWLWLLGRALLRFTLWIAQVVFSVPHLSDNPAYLTGRERIFEGLRLAG
jgi:hypothetical protein